METVGSNSGIMFGINGHPVQGGPYLAITPDEQMRTMAEAGFKSYRMDLYSTAAAEQRLLELYVEVAARHGVQILPVIVPEPLGYADERAAYRHGFKLMSTYALRFRDSIRVWELGNEYESRIGYRQQGSTIDLYHQERYQMVRELLRGMVDGCKFVDLDVNTCINTSGGCAWGFLDGLWDDGVRWDVTGEHWYSGARDITKVECKVGLTDKLDLLKDHFDRPIWITEINYNEGSSKRLMGEWLVERMEEYSGFAKRYDIEAFHIYELYDEPQDEGMEAVFGLWNADGTINEAGRQASLWLADHPSVVYR